MLKSLTYKILIVQVNATIALFAGIDAAFATTTSSSGGNDFGDIARNITESIEELPGLIAGIAYLLGILLGVLGILKVKDHVENPTQTPLKDGAVRMAAGGALFGLPIVLESMSNTIGVTSNLVAPAELNAVDFSVR